MNNPAWTSVYFAGYIIALCLWAGHLAHRVARDEEDFVSGCVGLLVGIPCALLWPVLAAFALWVEVWRWAGGTEDAG